MAKPSADRAYLIRCWQEGDAVRSAWPYVLCADGTSPGAPPGCDASPGGELSPSDASRWRFSAEEVLHERKRRGFADLASLLDYLRAEFGGELGGEREEGPPC